MDPKNNGHNRESSAHSAGDAILTTLSSFIKTTEFENYSVRITFRGRKGPHQTEMKSITVHQEDEENIKVGGTD